MLRMDRVRTYYTTFGQREWARLENPVDGAIEFEITRRALVRHLRGDERVLDAGGGPGRYAIWLAQRGHSVVLADLSAELLAIGRRRIAESGVTIEDIVEADVRDLSRWPDGAFGAALCLGPYYHLQTPADRDRAAAELHRVLSPGGLLLAAFMPRLGFLRRTMAVPDERQRLADRVWLERLLDRGTFDNDVPGRFDHGYGARPEEIEPFFAEHGFEHQELLAAEGISTGIEKQLADMAATRPDLYEIALELIESTAGEPSILGQAHHLLYVGRRR